MGKRISGFRARLTGRERLVGTFLKTPAHEMIEVLAPTGLDFLCLDAEHAAFDRGRLDACLALARAMDFPALVRVPAGTPANILMALDAGAVGVVVPHVGSAETAAAVAKAAHFGEGGRGFAGSTRWAGFATRGMGEVLDQSDETVVIAQIEEPSGVEACEAIAGVDGIDALFIGPADLSVAYGKRDLSSDELDAAFRKVGEACAAKGRGFVTWVPNAAKAAECSAYGLTTFVVGSEHSWMAQGAREAVRQIGEATG
ncbi:HpcH/HpaI aldolase family protein [Aestuariibius insulae]|uniref:HpcH/HpaI aldolase family protein n=1 Tax=Aestuariibius insulae TaxID=2058287 RepID=UPI00345EFF8A